jgi:hypothetical protein
VVIALSAAPALAGRDRDGFDVRDRYRSESWRDHDRDRDRDREWRWEREQHPGPVANVPEIDAASGLAALAAVCAALAFAWERRRRAREDGVPSPGALHHVGTTRRPGTGRARPGIPRRRRRPGSGRLPVLLPG